jgi:hypothetical protein
MQNEQRAILAWRPSRTDQNRDGDEKPELALVASTIGQIEQCPERLEKYNDAHFGVKEPPQRGAPEFSVFSSLGRTRK